MPTDKGKKLNRYKYLCKVFTLIGNNRKGTAVAQWLRCCATNKKVAGSIPDGVTGIFH